MAIFGPKPSVHPLGKMSIFRLWTSCFYSLDRCFFVLEYHKRHFPGQYCLKKKGGKIAISPPKPSVHPFGKMSIFRLWTSCFYSLDRCFFVLEYHKRHFPGQYCLKKKGGKIAISPPKPSVHPFGKMSIFRLFELLVFIA